MGQNIADVERLPFSIMSNIPTWTIKFSHGNLNKSLIMIEEVFHVLRRVHAAGRKRVRILN